MVRLATDFANVVKLLWGALLGNRYPGTSNPDPKCFFLYLKNCLLLLMID